MIRIIEENNAHISRMNQRSRAHHSFYQHAKDDEEVKKRQLKPIQIENVPHTDQRSIHALNDANSQYCSN